MKLQTASALISFSKRLEDESVKFYQGLSQKYPESRELFSSFAKENQKYLTQINRAYYAVISDAIEGCFAFDMDSDDHTLDTKLTEDIAYSQDVEKAIRLEKELINFYSSALRQSKSLMADVPRVFAGIVKKRNERIAQLKKM